MDFDVRPRRSLPPLVEGKVHGNLKLVIDEIVWSRGNPGDVTVVASWWGEEDSAHFRPVDSTGNNTVGTSSDTTEIYDIKTNATLFVDYIKNCESIELVVVAEKTHEVIGTVHVGELSKILTFEPYSGFFPILNNIGSRVGKIHVFLQLTYSMKLSNMQTKLYKYSKKHVDSGILLSAVDDLQYNESTSITARKNTENIKKRNSVKSANIDTLDTYRSVLKATQPEIQVCRKKLNETMTDKLVAQIVARAQRLRGAILKETYNEDSLALSDTSVNDLDGSIGNDTKVYEYILGKKMTSLEEKRALDILKSISPPSSLIDLASETIRAGRDDDRSAEQTEHYTLKSSNPVEDVLQKETYTDLNETHSFDYVDSIRIFIESFTMSPAGYRRAKSTCLQHDVPLTLTYFVQYNTVFGSVRQTDTKSKKDNKFIRTCAKKQVGRVIDFNSEGIYSVPRHILTKNFPLRFKVFVRHLNQKLPTELGCGSMNIGDVVNTANLSSTQRVTVANKGIKVGELKVTVELGCNSMNFGKQFVDAMSSAKENIPMMETRRTASANSDRCRSATGTHSSKSSNKVSSVSAKRIECFANNSSNKDLISKENIMRHREQNSDNKKIDTNNPESNTKDKVLLHGLIYVGEGKDLPESNTYLICRAFWREDKATSQICNNTKHPFYHFFQLVPLIHGAELLERIRDNHIIIEVYNRQNNGTDNLLGIAKLSVHQLYVAYRDPLVLPHLLVSKYPVISVDGWVTINDPISGKFCGELFALVALGTAEQIASLEMSRGLRNAGVAPRTPCGHRCHAPDGTKYATTEQRNSGPGVAVSETANLSSSGPSACDNFAYHGRNTPERDSALAHHKTQECQTDISSLRNTATGSPAQGAAFSKHLTLHTLVDSLANVLHVTKSNTDQSAQTELDDGDDRVDAGAAGELRLNTLNSNSNLNDDSNSCSPGTTFQPTEMYRSVGVGAEYEDSSQQRSDDASYHSRSSSVTEENAEKEESGANCDGSFFRCVVEIECALHLPRTEGPNESLEPSTYVTFQRLSDNRDHSSSYMMTNVFRHSCNPKWDWRCDAKLSTDLLLNDQKRLILKVWHLNDPDTSSEINLERDTVIGFSAIDLSVLMAGFPVVSGWFHIMDLTGKCNGQIKISITPLDSLLPLRKFAPTTNSSRCGNLSQTNGPHPYRASYGNADANGVHQTVSYVSHNRDRFVQSDRKPNDFVADIGHGLEDISMSFLSSSLKQKLTELDQITKRLQSRLRDVTNAAFEDDIDNDFDMIELNSDNENADDRNDESSAAPPPPRRVAPVCTADETTQTAMRQCESARNTVSSEKQTFCAVNGAANPHLEPSSDQCRVASTEATDTKYCTSVRYGEQCTGYYHNRYRNQHSSTRDYVSCTDNGAEHPVRGTRTHINHLLDKLSLDLPPGLTVPEMGAPMSKDILQLFAALRERRNSSQQIQDEGARAVARLDSTDERRVCLSRATDSAASDDVTEGAAKSSGESSRPSRMSTVIREELVAEENNDGASCDELTTYLLTSNVRHLDLDNIINPLLYQHLIPDLQVSSAASPETEAVKQLDTRYSRSFGAAACGGKVDPRTTRDDASSRVTDAQTTDGRTHAELSLSSASENADDSIDITVICKSANELMLSDNAESPASSGASLDELLLQRVDGKVTGSRSAASELSFPGAPRQAPEGGNPVEEVKTPVVAPKQRDTRDSAS